MSKDSKKPKDPKFHGLEAAYSLAFCGMLWWYFAGALAAIWRYNDWPSVLNGLPAFFISFQLLRMYYYLHHFEQEISHSGGGHFLGHLTPKYSCRERGVRLVLAGILVVIPKLDHTPSSASISITPALWLDACFFLLLVWDRFIWLGRNEVPLKGQTLENFREFFYLGAKLDGRYRKRVERILGLLATIVAVSCLRPNILSESLAPVKLRWMFFGFFSFCYVGFPLLGYTMMGKEWKTTKKKYFPPLLKYPVWPVYTVAAYFKPGGSDMRRWVPYLFLVILLVGLTSLHIACSRDASPPERDSSSSASHPARNVEIRIATSKNLWCTLTLVAEAKGYFREEGLATQMNYQAAGRLNMDALLGGAADFANVVETNIAYQALNRTSNLAILGKIVSAPDYAILTKAGSGIREPGDLRGKRLAYAQATGAESFVFWFLEKEKIPAMSLTLVPLQPAGLVDHFIGESTEAVATWEPFVTTIRGRIPTLGPTFQTNSSGFAGTMTVATLRDYARAHPSIVNAYERAMEKAARFVADNPADAQRIMAEQAGLPLEIVRSIWPRFDFRYSRSSSEDAALVRDVVRRIKANLPDMAKREPADVQSYFAPVQ